MDNKSRLSQLPIELHNYIYKFIFNDVVNELNEYQEYLSEVDFLDELSEEYKDFLEFNEELNNRDTFYVFRKFADKIAKKKNFIIDKDDKLLLKKFMVIHTRVNREIGTI